MRTIEELRKRYEDAYRERVIARRMEEETRVHFQKAQTALVDARNAHSAAKLDLERFIRESVGVTNGAD